MTSPVWIGAAAVAGATAGLVASARARAWAAGRPVPASVVRPAAPLVALACAGVWAGVVWRWGVVPATAPLLLLGWVAVAATDVDLRAHVIPDRLTLRAPVVLAALLVGVAVLSGSADGLVAAGVAAVVLPGALLATSLVFQRLRGQVGIGLGDVKFAITIGMGLGWLGAAHLLLAVLATFASAAAVVLVLLAARRVDLGDRVPFGPHLAVGTVVALIGGAPAASWVADVILR